MEGTAKSNNIFHSSNSSSFVNFDKSQNSFLSNTSKLSNLEQDDSYRYNNILNLQKTAGNQAVQKLIKSGYIQTKLKVSHPSDPYEQEADRIAEQIVKNDFFTSSSLRSESSNRADIIVNRKCNACEIKQELKDEEEQKDLKINRKNDDGSENTNLFSNNSSLISAAVNESGKPLDKQTRDYMESRFGYDFSNVRIHADSENITRSAESINALAYTVGNNIVFGKGQFQPSSQTGKILLAHELTHIVQQGFGDNKSTIQRKRYTKENVGDPPNYCDYVEAEPVSRGDLFYFQVSTDDFAIGEEQRLIDYIDNIKAQNSSVDIDIYGMASSEGDLNLNQALSCYRADAVSMMLKSAGLGDNIRSVRAGGPIPDTAKNPTFRAVSIDVQSKNRPDKKIPAEPTIKEIKLVGKSFIAPITQTGISKCIFFDVKSQLKLEALAAVTEKLTGDHPVDDSEDKSYRLFSERKIRVGCLNGKFVTLETDPLNTDKGKEGFIDPPDLEITDSKVDLEDSGTLLHVSWMAKGRPANQVEPGFQLVCFRRSRFIWHHVDSKIKCNNGDISVTTTIIGSQFPSHSIFERISTVEHDDSLTFLSLKSGTISQKAFSRLWNSSSSDPNLVE